MTRAVLGSALVLLTACSPTIHDTLYQSYSVKLNGPVPEEASPTLNPFVQSASYSVTLSYFEDPAGKIPYGTSIKTESAAFKNFNPVQTFPVAAGQTTIALPIGGSDQALPRLSTSQTVLYLKAEVNGLDANGNPVARARCPVQALRTLANGATSTVTCQAFFGMIGKWNEIRPPAQSRFDFGAASLPDGRVVIGGGKLASSSAADQIDLATVEVYDPIATDPAEPAAEPGIWTTVPVGLSQARSGLTGTATLDGGYVFFVGGEVDAGGTTPTLSGAVDVYDADAGTMLPAASVAPLSNPRAQHGAAAYSGDTVFSGGGISALPDTPSPTLDILTPTSPPRSAGGMLSAERHFPCMVSLPNSQILVCGGATESALSSSCDVVGVSSGQPKGTLQEIRGDVKCTMVGDSVYLVGGVLANTSPADAIRIEAWSGGQVTAVANAPVGLTMHSLAVLNSTQILVAGGYAQGATSTPLATGFILDTDSHAVTPLTGPSAMNNARARHQIVPLPDGTVMAIGGLSNSPPVPVGAEIYVP